jgi:hypothetical protein
MTDDGRTGVLRHGDVASWNLVDDRSRQFWG